ncbi:MAG: S8 family serine peptidase [Gammaproteobacteria bacterium]|nr:S8 family serine peptidase [Gammaproteobacteria bacterium]
MRARSAVLIALLCPLLVLPATAGLRGAPNPDTRFASRAPADNTERVYIVELRQPPALGNPDVVGRSTIRSGFLAGSVNEVRFDPTNSTTRTYVRRLQDQQQAVLASLNLQNKELHSYNYTLNGFAVSMTPAQAAQLRLHKQVANVWQDRRRRLTTSASPAYLGLLDAGGGLRADLGLQGDDVIIAVIDSGVTPQHPSLSERAQSKEMPNICRSTWGENSLLGRWLCRRFRGEGPLLFESLPDDWNGTCETGPNFTGEDCDRKLIGARFYIEGFETLENRPLDENEFRSPADADGHGTHIASIAAGNEVEADIYGRDIGRISGMAPRARVAVYKACWLAPGGFRAQCSVSDLVAAIDDAVADGVDIINYSIGSRDSSLDDPDDLALLRAAEAGVLSVVATGNDGPEIATMQSPATTPWVISVGASSRGGSRTNEALRVNEPAAVAADYEVREAAFTPLLANVGPVIENLVLVDDDEIETPEGEAGTTTDACGAIVNDDEIANKIAFIQRGGCDFDLKIQNAQDAGAIAVVVFSNDQPLQHMVGETTGIDIPAVMIGQADGMLLRDRLDAGDTVEVRLDKDIFVTIDEAGDIMGTFSGRGPGLGDPDFLKPDVTAPGVRILGGHTPNVSNSFRGEQYQYLSGTSQSAPHVAGIAALLKQQNPDWTPAELKSALMTTARQDIVKTSAGEPADPFDMGAGHIVPNEALNPGLVYPIQTDDYYSYLCKFKLLGPTPEQCGALALGELKDAADINLPSIAITELVTSKTITRQVRNTGSDTTYVIEIDAPPGIDVSVDPATLVVSGTTPIDFDVTFTRDGAPLDEWQFGSYTWVSDNHRVYSPFAVQPVTVSVTPQIVAGGASGSAPVDVEFGYDGNYSAVPVGLELPCVLPDNNLDDEICTNSQPEVVVQQTSNEYVYRDTPAISTARFTVLRDPGKVGTVLQDFYFRLELNDRLTDGLHDLDIYVYDCADTLPENAPDGNCDELEFIGASTNVGTSNEFFEDFKLRGPGEYIIDVFAYDTDDGDAQFCLLGWSLGPNSDAGNLMLANVPGTASSGTVAQITAGWTDLDDGLWVGGVQHRQNNTTLGLTLVDINVNGLPEQDPDNFACP